MGAPIDWDTYCTAFLTARRDWWARMEANLSDPTALLLTSEEQALRPPESLIRRLAAPTGSDLQWLTAALKDEERKLFVSHVANADAIPMDYQTDNDGSLSEALFVPLLDAGIDEANPSCNRYFVEPCVKAFGRRRVKGYLLDVIESEPNHRKAGAVSALYWTGLSTEARALLETLADVYDRQHRVLLETFVNHTDLDVRQTVLSQLRLDPEVYPRQLRPLLARAITIARTHPDAYIRARLEVQLGEARPKRGQRYMSVPALPYRKKRG